MSLHGRNHVGEKIKLLGEIFLNEQVDRMTAGGNYNIPCSLVYHALVFVFDNGGPDGGFLHVVETDLFKGAFHGAYSHALVICHKGGCKADNDRLAALKKHSDLFGFVNYLLCVLRTYYKTLTAQNTFVSDYIRLVSGKSYGFHGAMAYTFITVFAV